MVGICKLPAKDYAAFPYKLVEVKDNGEVYALIPRKDKTVIARVQFGRT